MTLFHDAITIARKQQIAHRHLDNGDIRSAFEIMEESKSIERDFVLTHGDKERDRLFGIVRKSVPYTDTSVFVALTGAPYVEDYGKNGANRILEAVYAALVGTFDEPYFSKVESFVTIDHDLADPIVVIRDLDESRNAHYNRLTAELVQWAYTEAVTMEQSNDTI